LYYTKGHLPWNKGLPRELQPWFGKKRPDLSERTIERNRIDNPMKRPEAREKISKSHKGKKRPCMMGENNPMKRPEVRAKISGGNNPMRRPEVAAKIKKPLSEEHKKHLRENHADFRGEKNPSWQGGKSFEPYGLAFNNVLKEQIRKRDNCQCQECGYFQKDLGYNLTVHHIDYNKKNNNTLNLISLCKDCHAQTNFGRGDWADYFKQKMENKLNVSPS